ncbi:TPA: tannase [Streptococcus suis]|nr:tannase [Streptococcus suis]
MSHKKWLYTSGAILLTSTMLLTACTNQNSDTTSSSTTTVNVSSLSSGTVTTTLDKIDNSKWQYNATDNVYYQIGISYAANPTDADQQTLSIFVPGDYMEATDNGDGTYTATLKEDATVGNYTASTAPIVIPIDTPGYSAMAALTEYSDEAKDYTAEGMIFVSAGLRGRDSGAPAGVTDAKAAIRYLRYNQDNVAGNTEAIFVAGMSGGGAQSAIIGASGDSSLYDPYLKEIGAVEGVSDAVAGVMAWCPVTNLDTANQAYEWNMGSTRTDLDQESQALSDGLATNYATYINALGLKDEDGNVLTLEESDTGIYQAGSYYEYVKSTIEDSLNTFLENTTFPYDASASTSSGPGGMTGTPPSGELPPLDTSSEGTAIEALDNIQRSGSSITLELTGTYDSAQAYIDALNTEKEWVTYDASTNTAKISSVADFVTYMKSVTKGLGAFDALDESQGENELFGYGDGTGYHWDSVMAELLEGTSYEADFTSDLAKTDSLGTDVQTRIDMYTPLYYLSSYYDGINTSNVAQHWRIRSGLSQGDTAVSTELNLALALENYGVEEVDFATVWGQQHVKAEVSGDSTENFIEWVKEATN